MPMIAGCDIAPVDRETCEKILDWVNLGSTSPWPQASDVRWLLAHCDDGVIWGYRDMLGPWQLSSGVVFPSVGRVVSPMLKQKSLQQFRVFGDAGELLVWRSEDGLRGRWLQDAAEAPTDKSLRPKDEIYLLLGDRLLDESQQGFSLIGDATGSRHAVPLECASGDFRMDGGTVEVSRTWPLHLEVRHYLEQDSETGVVRLAVSRLMRVSNQRHKEDSDATSP